MDLNFFTMLWVAYLQVHSFGDGSKVTGEEPGTLWTCDNDPSKIIFLNQYGGSLRKPGEDWVFAFNEFGTVTSHKGWGITESYKQLAFGWQFELWLADAFENIKCDPDSHVDFETKIEAEKSFIRLLMGVPDNQVSEPEDNSTDVYFL